MLVTCTNCKSPVFVSGATVAEGDAIVTCGSCKMRLTVTNNGAASKGTPAPASALPSPAGEAVELPNYAAPKVAFAPAAARVSFEPIDRGLGAKAIATTSGAFLSPPPATAAPSSLRSESPAASEPARPEPAGIAVDSPEPQPASVSSPAEIPKERDGSSTRDAIPGFLATVPAARTEVGDSPPPRAHALPALGTPASPPEPVPRAAPAASGREGLTSTQEFYLARVRATAPTAADAWGTELEIDEWAPRRRPRASTFALVSIGIAVIAVVGFLVLAPRQDGGTAVGGVSPPGAASIGAEAARVHYRRANQHLAAERAALAIEELQKCLQVHPGFGVAYRSLGVAYMQLGRERAAIDAYARFVQLEPTHPDAVKAGRIVESYRRRARSAR